MSKLPLALILPFIALPGLASAHGIYLAERAGDTAIIYGHGSSDEAYKAEKIKSVVAISADGKTQDVSRDVSGKYTILSAPKSAVALATVFDNGFFTKGPDDKSHNLPKKDVPGAKSAGHYIKYNTHIVAKLSGPLQPTKAMLEIVPLVDPLSLEPDAELPVQVFFKGKPHAGVKLVPDYINRADDNTHGTTDADGKISIPVANDGLNVIAVSVSEETPNDVNADKIGHFATLSFALPHHEH